MRKALPCEYCGEPMLVARGGIRQIVNSLGLLQRIKNPDQVAKYHKRCRTAGRKQERDSR